jgi:hypothetical protein
MQGGSLRSLNFDVGFGINDRPLTQADRRVDNFKQSVVRTTDRMGALERKAVTAGRAMSNAFSGVKRAMGRGIALLERYRYQLGLIAGAGIAAITKSVFSAGDARETVNKFNVVFGEVADSTKEWANQYSNEIGRSKYATMDWLNSFQDVLVPMGLARDEAAGLSKEMVQLSADLGSFNNVGTAEAANAMQSALMGNHRAVKSLGAQLNEENLNARAAAMGYKESFRQLDSLSKMQIRYKEIVAQSQDSIGDAIRTSEEWNNQVQRFKGNIRDVSIAMGFNFIPRFTEGLIVINKFLDRIEQSEKLTAAARFFTIGVAITGIAAAIGMVSSAWPMIGAIFSIQGFGIAGAVMGLVLLLEDLWVGLNGGEAVLNPLIDFTKKYKTQVLAVAGAITAFFAPAIYSSAIPAVSAFTTSLFLKGKFALTSFASGIWTAITASFAFWKALITKAVVGVASFATSVAGAAWTAATTFVGAIGSAITATLSFTAALLANPITWVVIGIAALGAALYTLHKNWDTVSAFLNRTWNSFIDNLSAGVSWIKEKFVNLLPDVDMPSLPDIAAGVKNKFNQAVNWVKENPLKAVNFSIPTVNLPNIINKIYESGRQFIKDKTGIELPALKLPTLPDLVGVIKGVWNRGKEFVGGLNPFKFPDIPDLPDPIAKIDEWAANIKSKLSNIDFGSALKTAIENAMDKLPGWMQGMAKKVMDYLPQSPAKVGPLSRLDKVGPGLTQTIGKGVDKSREQVTGPLSNMWTESMIAEPKTIVRDYNPMSSISDSGFGNSKSVTTNNYNNSNSKQQRSVKKVDKIEIVIQDSGDSKQTAVDVRKEIEKYFDMEATSSVGEATG